MFQTKVVEKNQNTHFEFFFVLENRVVYEIMWKKSVEPDRPHMTIWRLPIACLIPEAKATKTHSEYVITIAFHLQYGCKNTPHFCVIRSLPVLLCFTSDYIMEWK